MALSSVTYTAAPAQETFSVTFDYLQQSYVKVYVDGVEDTTFTWPTASTITLTSAASGGETVFIERTTPYTPVVTFSSVSTVTKDNLNNIITQVIHIAQEVVDDLSNALQLDTDDKWDADSKEIKGLADGQNSDEAVNKGQLDAAVITAGNVPTPADPGDDGAVLQASGGSWSWVSSLATSVLNVSANVKSILDAADFSAIRTLLGLGTVYQYNVGTGANNIVQRDGSGNYPAGDGSAITNLNAKVSRNHCPITLSVNGTDAEHDIDATAGTVLSDNGVNMTLSAITKQIDAAWAVGDDQGGLDTGSVAADTWYYVWVIMRSDNGVVDLLISASATSPTMPANYDEKRRIGCLLTDGSSNLKPWYQVEDKFYHAEGPITDINSQTPTTSATLYTMTVPPGLPGDIQWFGHCFSRPSGGSGGHFYNLLSSTLFDDPGVPSVTRANHWSFQNQGSGGNNYMSTFAGALHVNTNAELRHRSSGTGGLVFLFTEGWIDSRGRFDNV